MPYDYFSAVLALFDGTIRAILDAPVLGVFLAAMVTLVVLDLLLCMVDHLHRGRYHG